MMFSGRLRDVTSTQTAGRSHSTATTTITAARMPRRRVDARPAHAFASTEARALRRAAVAGVVAPISTPCGPGAAGTGAARSRG